MNTSLGFPILTVAILLPVFGAVAVTVIPSSHDDDAKLLGMLVALAELALAVTLVIELHGGQPGFQFVSQHSWISGFGIAWKVGVDGISVFLVAVTALLFPVAMAGPKIRGSAKSFMGWMLLLEGACIGTFLAMDLFLFFVLFEVTLVPAYFLISGWGAFRRNYAAMKFFVYTFAGSAFLLVGILSLVFLAAPHNGGHQTFDLITLTRLAGTLPAADQKLIFAAVAVAFAVKMPVVPFHTWMPDAYSEAPTAGSMILAGIVFMLGTYGILRFGVFIFPKAAVDLAPVLLTLGALGITYGAIVAIVQKDLKRLVAYASVADVGFIVLGLFAFSSQGLTGAVLEMVNHGLTTGALFFLVGIIWERRQTFKIAELGGLQKAAPVLAGVFVLVAMSAVGLPGLNGFVGEFLILVGTFITHRWWAVVGATGVILSAIYLLWAYQRVFHGVAAGANATVKDMTWRERGAILPLIVGIVFLGVYPKPVLDRITPSANYLVQHVYRADPSFVIPTEGRPGKVDAVPADQIVDGPGQAQTGIRTAATGPSPGSPGNADTTGGNP
ncbi:MAG: NADH-quinone oxidoreductase subunit M [Actinomycetota bacterium]|nr:NADH-quinone oxidoreductase subunit M [Actinomycetota bacterium]